MPSPTTLRGSGPDSQPATLMSGKLPASGDSLVSDGTALAAAMGKGAWPRLMMVPSKKGEVAFDDLLMVFAQRNATIVPARIGDLRTGIIPGGQYYARQINTSQQVYEGLTQLHTFPAFGVATPRKSTPSSRHGPQATPWPHSS